MPLGLESAGTARGPIGPDPTQRPDRRGAAGLLIEKAANSDVGAVFSEDDLVARADGEPIADLSGNDDLAFGADLVVAKRRGPAPEVRSDSCNLYTDICNVFTRGART